MTPERAWPGERSGGCVTGYEPNPPMDACQAKLPLEGLHAFLDGPVNDHRIVPCALWPERVPVRCHTTVVGRCLFAKEELFSVHVFEK